MKKNKIILGCLLLVIGSIGVASLITMDFPLPPETLKAMEESFSPLQVKLLLLINPLIFSIVAILIGVLLYGSCLKFSD